MRSRLFVFVLVIALGVGLSIAAEEKKIEKVTPGPDHGRLAFAVGSWNFEGELAQSPFAPAGKYAGTETCEWFTGEFAIVCRSVGNGPLGELKGMSVMGFDREDKVYKSFGIDSIGSTDVAQGVVSGDTWSFMGDAKIKGKSYKIRTALKELSHDSYTTKTEMSEDGSTWSLVSEGKATRVKKDHKPTK